jgi:16S rRNA (adenine1518-N6/adenine1519-N6)-dimethyltransferase
MPDLPFAKKSLGQHWLTDSAALQSICGAGEITPEDTVLEIGPGTGTLTKLLVEKAKQVIAVEYDPKLAQELPSRVKAQNLQVTTQDILAYDLTALPPDYKVVANIPYYLTSKLIRTLSETTNQASLVVVLVQKEVAQRVAANPGDMSLLSVSAQFYWQVSLGQVVPARLFTPPPKPDSQVLILRRRSELLFPDTDTKKFFSIVKAGFSARRKKLRGSISGGLRITKDDASQLLQSAGIDPDKRPQELSIDNWHRLYRVYEKANS